METKKSLHAVKEEVDQGSSLPIEGTDRVLVDQNGVAKIFVVTKEQINAVFEAVGGKAVDWRDINRLVFFFNETDQDLQGEIGRHTVHLRTLLDVMENLSCSATAQRREEIPDYAMAYDDMDGVSSMIMEEATELQTLTSAVMSSYHGR